MLYLFFVQVHQNAQHMGMYTQTGGPPVNTPQGMMHQQSPQIHQGQQQPPPNSQNTQASLASPLYPWMRSQFGKSNNSPFQNKSYKQIDLPAQSLKIEMSLVIFFTANCPSSRIPKGRPENITRLVKI